MGGVGSTQNSKQTIEQQLDTLVSQKCGHVSCKNVQDLTVGVGDGGKISGVKLRQRCAASARCAFDAAVDQAVAAQLESAKKAGALVLGNNQETENTIRQNIRVKVENECAGSSSENVQRVLFSAGAGGTVENIELDQSGSASLDCAAKTALSQSLDAKAKDDQAAEGVLDGINAVLKGLGASMASFAIVGAIFVGLLIILALGGIFGGGGKGGK